ncbi:formate/nitrite transporter family protein [Clostridium merdae]|uniref:formate/nitrite transporter family protein n=1 Tax=Clostridium merdae TaxID=1958780 RepID=UPI000A26751B|nr:formate/nitrite transporter family protein [Clostridium merdae]
MDRIRTWAGTFVLAILAGISIGIGCVIYMLQENPVIGSFLFSVGLMTICVFRWNLFTGKLAYISYRDPKKVFWLLVIWLGNLLGTFLLSVAMSATRQAGKLHEKALHLAEIKLGDNLLSLFILGIFCGLLMYVAVDGYRENPHPVAKYLGIVFSVMVFILCGFEHCVADMFYFWMAGALGKGLLSLVVISLGNIVGGAGCAALHRLGGRLIEEQQPAKAE